MSRPHGQKSTAVVVAADAGGTFTDLLLLRGESLTALKVPSTPDDPSRAVLDGLRKLLGERTGGEELLLIHGTTVATNAVLERKGARVGLITNRGFEDVIEIGRQDRPQLYALVGSRLPPLVSRDDRHGISGRLDPDGREVEALEPDELARLGGELGAVESIAICLLHSYASDRHEEAVAAALTGRGDGDAAIGSGSRTVSVSSRILPEFREYERCSTTVVNAFVAPRMARYLTRLREGADAAEIRVMGSAGGALPLSRAVSEPVRTVLSGPAGGVAGALEHGRRVGRTRLLSFDMGGTSTDVSLVPDRLLTTREGSVGDQPVAIPLMDIHTVGAGGGSIARVDAGGALRVGPESAGAEPGPIGYGRGGTEVTVTDANLWLGRLRPDGFLGGTARLDRDAVREPLEALARELGTDPDAAAEGVIEVADATMERALRVISVERGVDPDDFHLFSFGGAGGLHAAELAGRLGAKGVLIPPDPGLASAWGMLAAPIVRDRTRTLLRSSDDAEAVADVALAIQEIERVGRAELEAEGLDPDSLSVTARIDARYRGQSWELEVPADGWVEAFHAQHEARYGYRREGAVVEAVTARVRVSAPGLSPPSTPSPDPEGTAEARADVRWRGRTLDTPIHWRGTLPTDAISGPALVLEYSSTLWVPPGWRVLRLEGELLELSPEP
ncbi:MAG: hydantoinase/oxoprolinase family protein [Gemmatimonadales bacterium]|nr:MAG: hydantoinase/oxoprolinase family protein [Gemmatimonadales bacterium]